MPGRAVQTGRKPGWTEKEVISKDDQTRIAIVEAANAVFLEKGYHGAGMRQIAGRASIALGGIYFAGRY